MDGFTREFTETDDGIVWTVGLMMSKFFSDHAGGMFEGQRVLELGSGLGDLAVVLKRLGAHVTCSEQPKCLSVLQRRLEGTGIDSIPLLWGKSTCHRDLPSYNYVIGSEIIFEELCHDDLIYTLTHLLRNGATYYNAFADRPFTCMFFAKLHDAGFTIEEISEYDRLGLEPDRVAIHRIRLIGSPDIPVAI